MKDALETCPWKQGLAGTVGRAVGGMAHLGFQVVKGKDGGHFQTHTQTLV